MEPKKESFQNYNHKKIVKEGHSEESQAEQKRVYLLGNLLAQVIIRLLKGGLLLDAVLLGGLRDAAGADGGHRRRLP